MLSGDITTIPSELHKLILAELGSIEIINLYIACLCSKDEYIEKRLRPYFFRAINTLDPMDLHDLIQQEFHFTNRKSPQAHAYHYLKHLAQHTNDPVLFALYALITKDINTLPIARVNWVLNWCKQQDPGCFLVKENLRGILTALIYRRDFAKISTHGHSLGGKWMPADIDEGNIYSMALAVDTDVHLFPALISSSSPSGPYPFLSHTMFPCYYNLAGAFLSHVELNFKNTDFFNFENARLHRTLFRFNALRNSYRHNADVKDTCVLDNFSTVSSDSTQRHTLVMDYRLLSSPVIMDLVKRKVLNLSRIVIEFTVGLEESLDAFSDLQKQYSYNSVTILREALVQTVLRYLKDCNDRREGTEKPYALAFNHACFTPRNNSGNAFCLFHHHSDLSTSQKTLRKGYIAINPYLRHKPLVYV